MSRPLVFAILALPLFATPALAQPGEVDVRWERVDFSDLDINTVAGADELIYRIDDASLRVCLNHDGRRPSARVAQVERQSCVVDSQERAIHDVGSGLVTARYYGRTPEVIIEDEPSK